MDNKFELVSNSLDEMATMSEAIADIACRLSTDKINLSDGSYSANRALDDINNAKIKLKPSSRLLNLSAGNQGADGGLGVGPTTLDIFNELIQDVSPENDVLENSPFNTMLPVKTVNAVRGQQDIYESNYGWARPSNGVLGAMNPVPLLESTGQTWTGYGYNAISYIEGLDLIRFRELGSNNLTDLGTMQKMALQRLLLVEQVKTSAELVRTESLMKGSFTYNNVVDGTGLLDSQVYVASQSLGSYSATTNRITVNSGMTNNVLKELGMMLVGIQNMGIKISHVVIPNTVYLALFQSPPIDARTVYMSATSPHDVQGMRSDLFETTNIPTLAGVKLVSDDRAIKISSGTTTVLNTRPILYGETVDTASFRAIVIVEPSSTSGGVARTGNLGFFPNVYNRGGSPMGGQIESVGYNGNISLIEQDLSPMNWQNQRIQMMATTCIAPMIYLPNTIFVFDFNITID